MKKGITVLTVFVCLMVLSGNANAWIGHGPCDMSNAGAKCWTNSGPMEVVVKFCVENADSSYYCGKSYGGGTVHIKANGKTTMSTSWFGETRPAIIRYSWCPRQEELQGTCDCVVPLHGAVMGDHFGTLIVY